jgi:CHAD domain-containing protein
LQRALRKQKKACKDLEDEKPVHDLRVALRRCRSLAEDFSALDVHPVWRHLAKECKKQQRGLSDLRDVQVMAEWVRRLRLDGNSSDGLLAAALKKDERRARRRAGKSLENFPRKRWKEWLRTLPERAELIPVGESRLAVLAIDRLAEGHERERDWRKTHDPAAWHKLRVAMKRFRYTVESCLPRQRAVPRSALERLQDILGDGHDLDVLRERILRLAGDQNMPRTTRDKLLRRVARARRECVDRYEHAIVLGGKRPGMSRNQNGGPQGVSCVWDRWQERLARLGNLNPSNGARPATASAKRA